METVLSTNPKYCLEVLVLVADVCVLQVTLLCC